MCGFISRLVSKIPNKATHKLRNELWERPVRSYLPLGRLPRDNKEFEGGKESIAQLIVYPRPLACVASVVYYSRFYTASSQNPLPRRRRKVLHTTQKCPLLMCSPAIQLHFDIDIKERWGNVHMNMVAVSRVLHGVFISLYVKTVCGTCCMQTLRVCICSASRKSNRTISFLSASHLTGVTKHP